MKLRLGTRSSRLAMAQAKLVKNRIEQSFAYNVEILSSSSIGDKDLKSRLTRFRGQGVFTSGLELQLLDEDIDLAVHSLKDLPVEDNDGLETIAFIKRHHPGDSIILKKEYLISEDPLQFKKGLRFATGSPRRQSQLMHFDENCIPVDIRGNVETRISRLNTGFIDAVVMASAVFERIELQIPSDTIRVQLPPLKFPGAAGQGVIAIQVRSGTFEELRQLNHEETRIAATTERRILANAGGGCELSLGVYLSKIKNSWQVIASKAEHNWTPATRPIMSTINTTNTNVEQLEEEVQQWLDDTLEDEKDQILKNKTIFLTRSTNDALPYTKKIKERGGTVFSAPIFHYHTLFDQIQNNELLKAWKEAEWLVVSSQRTEDFLKLLQTNSDKPFRIATVGPKTAAMLRSLDLPVHVVGNSGMDDLKEKLKEARKLHPGQVIYLRGDNYHTEPAEDAYSFAVYTTRVLDLNLPPDLDYLVVYSKRTAKMILERYGRNCTKTWIAIGPTTGQWLKNQNIDVSIADQPTPNGILLAITNTL